MPDTYSPPRATRREWAGLIALALPTLLVSIDLTALGLAVPALSAALMPTGVQLLWINDIYGFVIAAFLVTMGTLGDRIGRRRLLMIGATTFTAASVVAAFSTSAEMLIVMRALMGLAGATLMPSTLALLRSLFADPAQRTFAVSVWTTCMVGGAALGPLAGGVMLEFFWWGSIFLLAVPVMALLLATAPVLLPESRDARAGAIDLLSAAYAITAMLLVVYGIKQFIEDGVAIVPVAALLAGLAVGLLFVRRQNRLASPLLDLRLFRERAFSTALSTQALGVFAMTGAQLFIAQYLQLVLGLSPLGAGLWTLPSVIAGIVGALATARLVARFRPAAVITCGLLVSATGFVIVAVSSGPDALTMIVAGTVLMSLGFGPVMPLATIIVINSAPAHRAGAAAATSETGSELGIALGVGVLGGVGLAVYQSEVDAGMPAGVPAEATDTARNTLGGAIEAAKSLPPDLAAEVQSVTAEAFTAAQQVTVLTSAVIVLSLAALVMAVLRRVPSPSAADEEHHSTAADPDLEPADGTEEVDVDPSAADRH